MVVGIVGSGNMAAAMARGWSGQLGTMLFSDGGSGAAARLAAEVGGRAVGSNAELARDADVIVLAIKPADLGDVVAEIGATPKVVVSLLAATPIARVIDGFPAASVVRVMPNVGVEVRRGVLCATGELEKVRGMLELVGHVVELPDRDFDAATAVMGCSPAYLALAVEALADAGARAGLDDELALELVIETTCGTAELLRWHHPAALRTAVASPGGSTEAGLQALEREGVREGFEAAVQASLERMRG